MSDSEDDNPYLKKVRAGRAVASGPPPAPPDPRTERAAELLAERPTGGPRPSALADLDAADERLEAVAPASRALLRELFERCEGAVDTSGAPDCARRAADVRADAARVREILALGDPAACPDARWTYGVALVTLAAERGSPMLRAVLEAGANPSAANEFTGETALELCIAKGGEVGVRILKAAGAKDTEA